MSDSAADESNRRKNFFCHSCSTNFLKHPDADYVCPSCQEGFIEEVPENAQPNPHMMDDEPSFISILAPIISGSLSGATSFVTNEPNDGSSSSGAHANRRGQRRQMLSFEDILQEILVSITEGANGRTPMFLNPADYAWGREGLDTIVTQLLNQMDNTGPPPLQKEKIDEIPKCEITQEQVDSKLQCSVCWEDFVLSEKVRQLPCLHVYHEDCILPWLQLHGTCPVCRESLVPEDESNSANASNNPLRFSLSGQASTSQHGHQESASTNNSSNSTTETQTTPETSGSRRLRDDAEFDID